MGTHAFLSASGAPAWSRCEAKPWREKDLPEQTSIYAQEGIEAHVLLEKVLSTEDIFCFIPENIKYKDHPAVTHVQKTLDLIQKYYIKEEQTMMFSERELDISFITGEKDAKGTADVVLVNATELVVIDLKYGMGVQIEAEDNEQLLIYGAAALEEFDLTGCIKTLRMVISQPRLDHVSEWVLPVDAVKSRIRTLRVKARRILAAKGGGLDLRATPGDKQCHFCKLKTKCPERNGFVLTTVTDDFVDLDKEEMFLNKVRDAKLRLSTSDDKHLATCLDAVGMIEDWCKGVREEVNNRFTRGNFSDPRYKLVQGRGGNRRWGDTEAIAKLAETYSVKVHEEALISPARLEKDYKGTEFWKEAQGYITKTEGRPTVVPASDKRPALEVLPYFDPIKEEEYGESLLGLTRDTDR